MGESTGGKATGAAIAETTGPPLRPGPEQVLLDLRELRPDLVDRYLAALPGARASVLARLWGALLREPIDGIHASSERGAPDHPSGYAASRGASATDGYARVILADGRTLRGPAPAGAPFATVTTGLAIHFDETTDDADPAGYTDPGRLLRALRLPGAAVQLAGELDNSVANLALARAAQPQPQGAPPLLLPRLPGTPDPLATIEQCVVDGHPIHPCCRTRTGMSTMDVLSYAPEHRPTVGLELVAFAADRVLVSGAWPDRLRDGSRLLLPMHPWQVRHLGLPAGAGRIPARPLMSLRTLSPTPAGWPWHVKTAVDVQMTSAVRIVSPAAVRNGPALSRLLVELTRRIGGIAVLPEVAAAAVLVDGEPDRSRAAALRLAPAPGPLAIPFAALAAPSPTSGRALITEAVTWYADRRGGLRSRSPGAFLAETVTVSLPPLVALLDLGVALEAHGQNTLLLLDRGRPAGLLYRDLGGVRISPARLRRHGIAAPRLHGDVATDEPDALRTKLAAAILSTVVSELVAVLAREYGEPPDALWRTVALALRGVRDRLDRGPREALDSLCADPWPIKATTMMRLAADPLVDIWAESAAPLNC